MTPFRSLLLAVAIGGGVFFLTDIALAQAPARLAVIDLKRVFDSYWKTKQADANLKERARQLELTRQRMNEDFKKSAKDYRVLLDAANDPVLSATERAKRKQTAEQRLTELRELEQSADQFDAQSRRTLDEQQRLAREAILREIRDKVTVKARQRGYTMVLDTAAETVNQTPVMIFNNGDNDITSEIMAELNANPPPTAFATPSAPTQPSPPAPPARFPTAAGPIAPAFSPGALRK